MAVIRVVWYSERYSYTTSASCRPACGRAGPPYAWNRASTGVGVLGGQRSGRCAVLPRGHALVRTTTAQARTSLRDRTVRTVPHVRRRGPEPSCFRLD